MRIVVAALIFATLTIPSYAQNRGSAPPVEPPKIKVDEKAYQSAVKQMGDQGKVYDPWRNVREPTPSKEPQPKEKPARGAVKR